MRRSLFLVTAFLLAAGCGRATQSVDLSQGRPNSSASSNVPPPAGADPGRTGQRPAPSQQAPLTASEEQDAARKWPAVKQMILQGAFGNLVWTDGPHAKGYMPVDPTSLSEDQRLHLSRSDNTPFVVWVVRGTYTRLAGQAPGGPNAKATTSTTEAPAAHGLWLLIDDNGSRLSTNSYDSPGAMPEITGWLPTPREDLTLS